MDLLDGLNPAQKSAVQVASGPLLILAGAGSGKTKTLTHRIAYLISQKSIKPDEILAVTFTNKAAKEMQSRVNVLLKAKGEIRNFMPWMGTFHSICVRLLRIDGYKIGISRNFVIYDEDDRLSLIKRAIKQLSFNDKEIKPKVASSIISSSKNSMIDSIEFQSTAASPQQKKIAKIYTKYEELKKASSALDFDDLLIETVKLLRENKEVRSVWQKHFKHILIDEYQDTNLAQYNIVKLLVGKDRNICVVGDDWQSIYSWRGADFTNILNFERDFKGATIIKLEQNYRSTASILEAAGNVISKNKQRTDKKLWTKSEAGVPVQVHGLNDDIEEADLVANRISSHVASGARQFGDFAVLYRTNAQSYNLERAFLRMRIPYQIVGGVRFYDRREIKDIVAYLKFIYQPNDSVSFNRIVNTPARGIGNVSLDKFLTWQANSGMDIVEALVKVNQVSEINPRARQSFQKLGNMIKLLWSKQDSAPPSELINQIIELTNYKDYIYDGTPQFEERVGNLNALMSDAQNYINLSEFLEEISLMSSIDSYNSGQHVTLMTLHASKGLEFPVVFIVGLEEGILPHARVYESGPSELEEERRLMYVGMTRAREELHLTYARSRLNFGGRVYNPVSRFISDMGVDGVGYEDSVELISDFDISEHYIDESFEVGDRVKSNIFGIGEIVDVDGLAVTVNFDNGKSKKLNIEYARLEKT